MHILISHPYDGARDCPLDFSDFGIQFQVHLLFVRNVGLSPTLGQD